jgi:hypothetical protein
MVGTESAGLTQHSGAGSGLADLQSEGQVAGEQAKPDRNAIGMQAGTDQVIEIMPINQFVNHLLHAPALAIKRGQAPGAQPLTVRDVDSQAPGIARGAGRQRDELQPGVPGPDESPRRAAASGVAAR